MDKNRFEILKEYYHKNRLMIWVILLSWLTLSLVTSKSAVLLFYLEARPRVDTGFYYLRGFLMWTLITVSIPVIIELAKRYPIDVNRLKNIALHIVFSILFIFLISTIIALILISLLPAYRFHFMNYFFQNLVWSSLAISVSYWFIVCVVLLKNNYSLYIEKKQKSFLLDAELKKTQLQLLREQLRPHFLFNALNSVNSLIFTDKVSAAESLKKIRAYLKRAMNESSISKITLEKELEFTQLYIDIEKERYSDRLLVETNIEDSVRDALVPAMILQPLAENAIRHGIASSEGSGRLIIQAKPEEKTLHLSVENSGNGFNSIQMVKGAGIGIQNTTERLKKLYDGNFTFDIDRSELGGWRVSIRFPADFAQVKKGS